MLSVGGGITLPDENTPIGAEVSGGFFAGIIDTSAGIIDPEDEQSGAILSEDEYQTSLRYALIVAPESLRGSVEWRTSSATVNEARTLWDGLAAQEALVAPNGNSTYPAFNYCHGINDDGGTPWTGDGYGVSQPDEVSRWYLPALDELTEAYWRLKPTTDDNSTGTTSSGDFPSGNLEIGRVFASDPQRPPFTEGTPEQTDVADFQEGGDEAWSQGRRFLSASWASSASVWSVDFLNGGLSTWGQEWARWVRPFRRVILPPL